MLQGEHSAILSTFIKLPFVNEILFCLFFSGRFTQVLLYSVNQGLKLVCETVTLVVNILPKTWLREKFPLKKKKIIFF